MKVDCLTVGPLGTNCYLAVCENSGDAVIVDAADEVNRILERMRRYGANVRAILQTHGHPDHVGALAEVVKATGAEVWLHPLEAAMLDEYATSLSAMFGPVPWPLEHRTYSEGDLLSFGTLSVRVLHTPGHTPGSVCLLIGGNLFSGDTLFAGGVGRWDLPGGDWADLELSLRRLAALPEQIRVFPGHGPATTIGQERDTNEWLAGML